MDLNEQNIIQDYFIANNESAIDAAADMRYFVNLYDKLQHYITKFNLPVKLSMLCGDEAISSMDEDEPRNVKLFKELTHFLAELYARKNADYGDSFSKSVEKYGIIAALTRMSDKWNRLENLILNKREGLVGDERIEDTLLDLASYCLMTVISLRE